MSKLLPHTLVRTGPPLSSTPSDNRFFPTLSYERSSCSEGQAGTPAPHILQTHPMPNPINFSVAPAQRSGSFQTSTMDYPGGYSILEWTLTGLGSGPSSDFENPNNSFTAQVFMSTDGGVTFLPGFVVTWQGGGPKVIHGVTDPPPLMEVGIGSWPFPSKAFIKVILTGTMTIGISGSMT